MNMRRPDLSVNNFFEGISDSPVSGQVTGNLSASPGMVYIACAFSEKSLIDKP
jgi:hypothetical protein